MRNTDTPLYRFLVAPKCPNCQAQPGEPCTQPTNDGRRAVNWVHNARRALAMEAHREASNG